MTRIESEHFKALKKDILDFCMGEDNEGSDRDTLSIMLSEWLEIGMKETQRYSALREAKANEVINENVRFRTRVSKFRRTLEMISTGYDLDDMAKRALEEDNNLIAPQLSI